MSFSKPLLYLSILVIAVCGIIYELIIGAVSAYLWGDSVLYFSLTIGLYMSAMGLGAYFSKYVGSHLFDVFVASEVLIGLVGGCSALLLFWAYTGTEYYEFVMVTVTVLIGMGVGFEIPVLIRMLDADESLRLNVAHVLSYDYVGGLIGALIFPLLLLPYLGLLRTALLLGLSNLLIATLNLLRHRRLLRFFPLLATLTGLCALAEASAFWRAPQLEHALEQRLHRDQVVVSLQTRYQKLTVTQWHHDIRLFINGGLQFSSLDEYRYHESLVHVPMAAVSRPQRVLLLGGGDGLAVRELLKYRSLEEVVVVDIDPEMTALFREHPRLRELNQNSLQDPRVRLVHEDAFKFVEHDQAFYDVVLVDLPDPSHTALTKLYSVTFYEMLGKRLSQQGVLVTQSTSPFFAKAAFWCIHKTLAATGMSVYAYQTDIPSFGNWGFQMARRTPLNPHDLRLAPHLHLRFLNAETLPTLFVFPPDLKMDLRPIALNTLLRPVLLEYYKQGWNGIR